MNLAWFTFLCAEEGGKVPMTFVMQALECGHLTSSIVSGSLASHPVAAFVLLCGNTFYSFCIHITTTFIYLSGLLVNIFLLLIVTLSFSKSDLTLLFCYFFLNFEALLLVSFRGHWKQRLISVWWKGEFQEECI